VLYVVLALWLTVGTGVFVLALTGGPGGFRKKLHSEGKIARRVRASAIALVAAFGLGAPIAVAVANGLDKARVGPAGMTLTKAEATGRMLFTKTCSTCHTLAAAASDAHVGPNLDILRPNEALVVYSIKNGFAAGRGQMPAAIYTGQQAKDVAQFVAATAGQ
jgi:mono/diheme cytochrome c family protein